MDYYRRLFVTQTSVFLLVLFLLFFQALSPAMASGPTLYGKSLETLKEEADREGHVDVIARLDVDFIPEGAMSPAGQRRQRDSIKRAQQALLSAMSDSHCKPRRKFGTIPWVSMSVDSSALEALSHSPLIKGFREIKTGSPLLAQTVPTVEGDTIQKSGTRGESQTVVVLDSGLDLDHPAFSGKVVDQACFSSEGDCPDGSTSQTTGDAGVPIDGVRRGDRIHGTHVTGAAVGRAVDSSKLNSSVDLSPGVAPDANVIPIMVFSDTDPSKNDNPVVIHEDDPVSALEYVYNTLESRHNIASINLSFKLSNVIYDNESTCEGDHQPYEDIISNLVSKTNIPVFAASGNGDNHDGIKAPACLPSAFAVGATDTSGIETLWSPGSGIGTDRHPDLLDLLSPGIDVLSAVPGDDVETLTGTSMAAPHAAGAWALLQSRESTEWDTEPLLKSLKDNGNIITDSANGETYPSIRAAAACDSFMGSGDLGSNCYPGRISITRPADGSSTTARKITASSEIRDANLGDTIRIFRNNTLASTDTVTDTDWTTSLRLQADLNTLNADIIHNTTVTNTDTSTVTLSQDLNLTVDSPRPGSTINETPFQTDGSVKALDGDTLVISFDGTSSSPFQIDVSGSSLDWKRQFEFSEGGNKQFTAKLLDRNDASHALIEKSFTVTTEGPATGSVPLTSDFKNRRLNNEVKTWAGEDNFGVMFISGSSGWSSYSGDPAFDPSNGEFIAVDHPDQVDPVTRFGLA
ncbi:MAG: S8 family serine peptidase, partial [bacterium]